VLAPESCRSETQGKLGWKISQYSLLKVFSPFSQNPELYRLSWFYSNGASHYPFDYESNGPVAPVYSRLPADRPVGRKAHNAVRDSGRPLSGQHERLPATPLAANYGQGSAKACVSFGRSIRPIRVVSRAGPVCSRLAVPTQLKSAPPHGAESLGDAQRPSH
jgi:hypothetical protein